MNIEAIITALQSQASIADPIGAKIKFVLDEDSVLIDGTNGSNEVSQSDSEADCTISTSKETFVQLKSGELNPMMAVMSGKIKIQGDMGLAMKLQSLL